MDQELIKLIGTVSENAETIIYVYLLLEYGSIWLCLGMLAYGASKVWKVIRKDFE